MKWEGQEQSRNVEDRRGMGGGMGMPRIGGRGIGIGTIVIAVLAGWIFGINPLTVLGLLGGGGLDAPVAQAPGQAPPADDRQRQEFQIAAPRLTVTSHPHHNRQTCVWR